MIYGNCVPKLMRNGYRKKSHSNLRKKIFIAIVSKHGKFLEYLWVFFLKNFQ